MEIKSVKLSYFYNSNLVALMFEESPFLSFWAHLTYLSLKTENFFTAQDQRFPCYFSYQLRKKYIQQAITDP